MGLTKLIFIEKDPAYAEVRRQYADDAAEYVKTFTFRLPTKRRNRWTDSPRWDPFWQASLTAAAKALEVQPVFINSGMFFRTADDRDSVNARAEEIWRARTARFHSGPKANAAS